MNTSAPIAFRTAVSADIPAIVALVESAYRGESGLRGWTTESHLLDGRRTNNEDVGAVIKRPHSCLLLAERDGQLIASCHVERQGKFGYFGMFAVDPAQQGGGLGKAVLAEAERLARERWQCRAMRMTVIEQRNELIAWYERRGYLRTAEYEPFPYGDERFGIPRRPDLRFEVLVKTFAKQSA
ncbi:N-acetyltransferase [Rhodanobacter sp. MP1X3]|jgi:ribosomal protein S18 acetylase RimI-like enzyme|uniref:GNAT family N-acetyltransferase n=1 Tax=Rhodanobacter sp. MP1X3 TaxID=2723086 RepID=UPI0016159E8A|nr:N-acetyltransferase [Rhodanobacter sp. MP1X3]MBB6244725.1 ribosomal protein S18 acetylase RimI-like enzyme [Rhodanobacter sp. MP1X3]